MSGNLIKKLLCLRQPPTPTRLIHCAALLGRTPSTVKRWEQRCKELGITYEKACGMSDEEVHKSVCFTKGPKPERFYPPDFSSLSEAMEAGWTKSEVFERYTRQAEESGTSLPALKKSAFFARLGQYLQARCATTERTMVQQWRCGEYMQIDYAGDVIELKDGPDGKQYRARIFVATLCFSHLTFWYATSAMTTDCWIEAILKAFEYFGGLPKYILLDNDTALVNRAEVGNKSYNAKFLALCKYHLIEPAAVRPASPRDKGQVEGAVRHVTEKFIKKIFAKSLASLKDVNILLQAELEKYNNHKMVQYGISRRQWFEAQERSTLRGLPKARFTLGGIYHERKVRENGCVCFESHSYLMPKAYYGCKIIVNENSDNQLHFLDALNHEEICIYPHFSAGKPDPTEGFTHAKAELQAPGELTSQARLDKAFEKVKRIGPQTEIFISNYRRHHSHQERGQLADSINWLAKKLSGYESSLIEQACEHVVAMNVYDKDRLISSLEALRVQTQTTQRASSNKGACLRSEEELINLTIQ